MSEQTIAKKCAICDKLFNGNNYSVFCPTCKECLSGIVNLVGELKKFTENPEELGKLTDMFNMNNILQMPTPEVANSEDTE